MIPGVHGTLGGLYRTSWEWDKAEKEFNKEIELYPNNAEAYQGYAFYLLQLARHDEAIKNMKIAIKLDPLSLIINQNLGELYYYVRNYNSSIEATKRTIEMDPAFPQAHYFLGMAYLAKGMYEEAMEEFQIEKNLPIPWNSYYVDSVIGVNYAKQGMMKEAEKILSRLRQESLQTYIPPRPLAYLCFAVGKKDEGLDFLEIGYAIKNSAIAYLKVDPLFDSVRTDPRFIKLIEKIGLN
jgi:tetratricopeptide (TPR) repeat protein